MKIGRRLTGSDLVDRVEQRLSGCPLFAAVAVARDRGGLLVVVNPDLQRIWETGSADLNGIVRLELAEALRSIGAGEVQARIAITRARLPIRLDKQTIASDLRPFFGEVHPAIENEVGQPGGKNESPTVDTWMLEELWYFLRMHFPEHRLTRQTCPRLDLGLDSLDWLEILLAAEEQTGIGLSEEIASGIITLGDLEDAFLENASLPSEASLKTRRQELMAAPHLYQTMRPRSKAARRLGFAIHWFNRALFRHWFHLKVHGLDNLPDSGPFILAPNHTSDLDVPVMLAAIPSSRVESFTWGGNRERLFATRISRFFCHLGHVFPLDDRVPLAGLAIGVGCLRQGRPVVWYPESWRSPDGQIQPLKLGIGILAHETGAAILPVTISGTFEALPRHKKWPSRHAITVRIAAPCHPQELERKGEGDNAVSRIVDGLWGALRDLSGEQ